MLGAEAVPAFVFAALCPFLIESPRWLAEKASGHAKEIAPKVKFWCKANYQPILIAIAVAFFNQLSGINAIMYFMKRIYMMAGFTDVIALKLVAMTGIMNAMGTFLGMMLIDKLGRKTLLILGGSGYVIALLACTVAFHLGLGAIATACVILFIISHAFGQGTVIWVLIAEVFPQQFRAQGQALGSFTHWFFAALITLVFPLAAESLPAWTIFAFFGVMMVFHFLWALVVVPETKGRELS